MIRRTLLNCLAYRTPTRQTATHRLNRRMFCLLLAWVCYCIIGPAATFAQAHALAQNEPLVSQVISYQMDQAGEVMLVWGINGWMPIAENLMPAGTVLHNHAMFTPMTRKGDAFVAKIQVPHGAIIDYAFQITKTIDGTVVDIWDANGDPKPDYHTYAVEGGFVGVRATDALTRQLSSAVALSQTLWYMLFAGVIGGGFLAIWLLRRRRRDPFMDF